VIIDWKKLRAAIHEDVRALKEMKARKLESGHPHWNGLLDERNLIKAKKRATIHCSIAAHSRKKMHTLTREGRFGVRYPQTMKDQEELIADYLPQYLLPEPETEVPSSGAA
jgi:hypothetical protein